MRITAGHIQSKKAARRRPHNSQADGELTVPASSPLSDIPAALPPNCFPTASAAQAHTTRQPRPLQPAPCCKSPNSDVRGPASSAGPADAFRSLSQLPTPTPPQQLTPVLRPLITRYLLHFVQFRGWIRLPPNPQLYVRNTWENMGQTGRTPLFLAYPASRKSVNVPSVPGFSCVCPRFFMGLLSRCSSSSLNAHIGHPDCIHHKMGDGRSGN